MLLGKFKDINENKINYLYLDDKSKKIFGFSYENGLDNFDNDKFNVFLRALRVNDDCIELFKYRGYSVYYDQKTEFKHYVKDGVENIYLFYLNNGQDALVYNESNEFDIPGVKMFMVAGIAFIIGLAGLNLCYGSNGVDDYLANKYFNNDSELTSILNNSADMGEVLTIDDMILYINNSPYLTVDDKMLFTNTKLLEMVNSYYCGTYMQNDIKNKLTDIMVNYYTREDNTSMAGYYSSLKPSVINVADDLSKEKVSDKYDSVCNDVKKHEFIHLLQADFLEYTYLQEAITEITAEEYYKPYARTWDYNAAVNNVKSFIDIIGPTPFMEYVFGGDVSKLVNILSDNLSYSDFAVLTKLLKFKPDEASEEEHNKIRDILCRLYENIYGDSIHNDGNILYDVYYNNSGYSYLSFVDDNRVFLDKDKLFNESEVVINIPNFLEMVPDNNIIDVKEMEVIRKQLSVDEYFDIFDDDIEFSYLSNTICGVVNEEEGCFSLYDEAVIDGECIIYGDAIDKMSIDDAILAGYVSPYKVSLKDETEVMPEGWEYTGMYGNALIRRNYISKLSNARVEDDKLVVSVKGVGDRNALEVSNETTMYHSK